jgi:diguanylate cyclase (GGDEF)-like protein
VLTLQLANAHYARGGPWDLVWIGTEQTLGKQRDERTRIALFLAGAAGVAGLYHLMLWLARRPDLAALASCAMCIAVMVRVLTVDDVQLLRMFPELAWAANLRLEYVSIPGLLIASWLLVRLLFPEDVPRWLALSLSAGGALYATIVLTTSTTFFTLALPFMQVLVVATALALPACVTRAAWRGRDGAGLFLLGFGAIALSAIHDVMLYTVQAMPSLDILGGRLDLQPLGLLVFIACQATALAERSSRTITALGDARDEIGSYARELENRVSERTAELEQANRELYLRARTDGLTGLYNRHVFDEELAAAWADHRRRQTSLALIMIDVDRFKRFNDCYGHLEGDAALRAVAGVLQGGIARPRDLAARYGGEEMAVILPDTDAEGARHLAEAMCEAVAALAIAHERSEHEVVTISAGVASATPPRDAGPTALVDQADTALYAAKWGGRGRVEVFLEESMLS